MNDFASEPEELVQSELRAVERVIRSGWWILGQEVSMFEAEWAAFCGCTHAIGVGNGMDAIEIGLRALGIGPGDEVVTTSMTAFATVLAIFRAGATPVLADIDPTTAILDPESVERCLSPRTKAVLVVHLYGQSAPMDRFSGLCRSRGIFLLEDCAQAHGAKFQGRSVGSWGEFGAWSFYPTKNLGCIGDGGAITTGSDELAERCRRLRNYGQSERYHHPELGLNSRLDELQAAILRERLPHLPEWTRRRRELARAYTERLSGSALQPLPMPSDPESHVHHLFVATTPDRDAVQARLREAGIETLCHYPLPIHKQHPCRNLPTDPNGLENAEFHARMCLSLPLYPWMKSGAREMAITISAASSLASTPSPPLLAN